MYDAIIRDRAEHPQIDWRIIHLGDYVDRGADSKGVIDFLIRATERESRVIALAGNHDIGFLDFLAAPDPDGIFANNGGRETALSYGVRIDFSDRAGFRAQAEALRQTVPPAHRAFLEGLGFSCSFGDFFFCHAGIRPGIPLDRQEVSDLIWIREAFLNFAGLHPKVVVHGHTPAREPEIRANRVNVDTGAVGRAVGPRRRRQRQAHYAGQRMGRTWMTLLFCRRSRRGGGSMCGGNHAVPVDHGVAGRGISRIDPNAANSDRGQHCKGKKGSFHGRHLGYAILILAPHG
jgi:serine/threonine protein phosphatase 1